jgi:hypothetical protein
MNLTVLEDERVWGLLPREITWLSSTAMFLGTVALIGLGFIVNPLFFIAAVLTLGAMIYFVRVTFHLRRLAFR